MKINKSYISTYIRIGGRLKWSFRPLCLFSFLFIFSIALSASASTDPVQQKILTTHYSLEEGLSSGQVTSILQDRNGFLWIGTKDGLNKFDGYEFTVFKYEPGNSKSISNNEINCLFEDTAGGLWIGTNGGLNFFNPKTEEFEWYQHQPSDANSLSDNYVRAVYEDEEGTFWVGGLKGLNRFDRKRLKFKLFQHKAAQTQDRRERSPQEVSAISQSKEGDLIIGYWGMGLMKFDKKEERFQQILLGEDSGLRNWVNHISKDKNGDLWISSTGNAYRYDPDLKIQERLPLGKDGAAPYCLVPLSSGLILSGSQGEGLYVLNKNFELTQQFKPVPVKSGTSSNDNRIHFAYEDQAGDVWIGTGGAGVFHIDQNANQFTNLILRPDDGDFLSDFYVTDLMEVGQDELWLSTRKHGITRYNVNTKKFSDLPSTLQFSDGQELMSLYQDSRENIWIGTLGKGVKIYNPSTQKLDHFDNDLNDSYSIADAYASCFLETQEGEIWMGTTNGISVFPNQEAVRKKKAKVYLSSSDQKGGLNHPWITALIQSKSGEIWIGTKDGLHLYDRSKDEFITYLHDPNNLQTLISNNILSLFEDSKGQLWVGTSSGLNCWNRESNNIDWITSNNGLVDNYVHQIAEDKNGFIWVTTNQGLTRINSDKPVRAFKNYNAKDGLFNTKPFLISPKNGMLYAGGQNGLSYFHTDSLKVNSYVPPVTISSLIKYNAKTELITPIEVKGIAEMEELRFSYQDQILTFGTTSINYRNTEQNQYRYQLEGFNESWINNGTKREISFTNLDPGDYKLHVIGSNNHGVWNEEGATLKFSIPPPWWQSTQARILYVILLAAIIYITYRALLRRQELKHQLQFEKSEAARLKELDSFKTRLTTNLTHEFRTPLTVILGMVGQMKDEPQKYLNQGAQLIESNGKNLMKLVNQMLDLSKIENQSFKLNYEQHNIIPYLRYLTESFQSYANSKNLSIRFFADTESLVMDYDPEQTKQIMTNLISNAVKYTQAEGEILIRVKQGFVQNNNSENHKKENEPHLTIEVKDSGIGIAATDLPYIFDRFYQVDGSHTRTHQGTGIGLAHTHELVRLMGGDINVRSVLGEGSSFIVNLPIRREEPLKSSNGVVEKVGSWIPTESLLPTFDNSSEEVVNHDNKPQLLIMEDNPDVVIYLKSCLSANYNLQIAYNGRIGIEKALENIPDLIISDVMMPEKDGYQVCDTLKNDDRTSHIPIVLLTAKADYDSKIAGLKRGADAYIAKPFDKAELLIRLQNLLKIRKIMANNLSHTIEQDVEVETELSPDEIIEDQFIQKVNQILADKIADENFSLPQLCEELNMSRSQLFRKMKAIINISPSQFIRSYRVKEAHRLLLSGEFNVSEVAWKVGFKDASHFTKVYKEKYGVPPSQIVN